jgi:hypothetical protein
MMCVCVSACVHLIFWQTVVYCKKSKQSFSNSKLSTVQAYSDESSTELDFFNVYMV